VGVDLKIPVGIALKEHPDRDVLSALEGMSEMLWKILRKLDRV
jgi:hypothetical protein